VARNVLTARLVVPLLVLAIAGGLAVGGLTSDRKQETAAAATRGPAVSTETTTPTAKPTAEAGLTASADTNVAGKGETVTISGRLTPPADIPLKIQRNMGSRWQDFNSSGTTKSDGSFSLTVQSGRTGTNIFRIVASGSAGEVFSNDVSVRITG